MSNWQTKRLSEIGTFFKGSGIPKDSVLKEGLPAVRYGELYTSFNVFVRAPRSFINQATAQSSTLIQQGDILFAGSGETIDEIGKSAAWAIAQPGYAGGDIVILRPNEQQSYSFLAHTLNSDATRKMLRATGQGQSVVHIYKKDLERLELSLPEKLEQQRIVKILELWDAYIEKLERKIKLKEQLKKSLMQQLLTGKRRLPGFNTSWQEVRLDDIATIEKGKSLSSKDLISGAYPVIAGGQSSPYSHANYTHENAITISASGAYAGFVSYHVEKIWASDCSVLSEKPGISTIEYLYYYMSNNQKKIYALQVGGAQPHVYPKDLAIIKLLIPKADEQLAIVGVLRNLDSQINTYATLKRQAINQKKYLLKNLISGTIRTPENLSPRKDLA
jgi:type I restriction enzyme, S subunit